MRRIIIALSIGAISILVLAACAGIGEDDDTTDVVDEVVTVEPMETPTVADDAEETPAVTDDAEETPTVTDDAEETPTVADDADETPTATEDDEQDDQIEEVSGTFEVTLTEYEVEIEGEVSSGIVVFSVTNEGEESHALSIESTDGEILGTVTVEPGEDAQLEVELESGDYKAFCPVGDHREEHGMETEFTVD